MYQIEIICQSCFDYYTLSFIVSGLLYNPIFWYARDSPCRELIFPCHIFCWYCIAHSDPGAAVPSITSFWILITSISSIGRGVVPVAVQITTAKLICQRREREWAIRTFCLSFCRQAFDMHAQLQLITLLSLLYKHTYLDTQSVKDSNDISENHWRPFQKKKEACTDLANVTQVERERIKHGIM